MELQIILKLVLAVILGGLIGCEREYKRKEAGLQTYSLVTVGSCLFAVISFEFVELFSSKTNFSFDPFAVISAIAVGIGFIGAGVIFRQPTGTVGITTAAGLWATAAIGLAVGAGFYFTAILGTLLTILIFSGFGLVEEKLFKK